ncbi:MAG: SDR family oxidoreductase [Pseudomonadota bacterium]|nr:SDR family oxidoreductase [Pseudomonadota bacterium]
MDLSGKNALVTGGSLGLGRAMASAFHSAGANVALLARRDIHLEDAKEEIEQNGPGKVCAYQCDVTNAAEIETVHKQVVEAMGAVDILVNNAGKSEAHPFMSISDAVWQADLDLKLFAAIRLARHVIPNMITNRWGRIINVLNTAAKAPPPGSAPTSVSRAAGMALTKVLAGEVAPHNILVNALLIGHIKSDQIQRAYDASDRSTSFQQFVAEAGTRLPMGRMGEASEVADVAMFLASEHASYLTGCAINMDGGLSRVV